MANSKTSTAEKVVEKIAAETDAEVKITGTSFIEKLKILQDCMFDCKWEKNGLNTHQSYRYIKDEDFKNNFKQSLECAGLRWECECINVQYIPDISEKMHLILADFLGKIIDAETGEYREYRFAGSGADNSDKALYKAYTGGLKYFISDNFLVAVNNDPENDNISDAIPKVTKRPANAEKREEIKAEVQAVKGGEKASDMQVTALKNLIGQWRTSDPSSEVHIMAMAEKTKNFENMSSELCEKYISQIKKRLGGA